MTRTNAKILTKAIRDSKKRLTPWEEKFVSSIEQQARLMFFFSDKQQKALEKIYRRVYAET